MVPRLITIPISHYCEKARWALELAEIEYVESAHLQLLHYWPAWRAGGGRTVPVLVTRDEVLTESRDILLWANQRLPAEKSLYPKDPALRAEVEQLERRFALAGQAAAQDLDLYQRTAGNLRRLLEAVGLQRRARPVQGLPVLLGRDD